MAESQKAEQSQAGGAGTNRESDELEDLEAPDADVKGGGSNPGGGSSHPDDIRRQ